MKDFNFMFPFQVDFSFLTGLSSKAKSTKRCLSQMRGMFSSEEDYEKMLSIEDKVVYEFYELDAPDKEGDLAFGTSITYPGTVGNEYFMTKGHYHTILDTAEVYYCLSGEGYMLMENPEGVTCEKKLTKGNALYVPGRFAHRSVNTGKELFVTFFVFRADAGHDYKTIETKGFRKLILKNEGIPFITDNPKWREN